VTAVIFLDKGVIMPEQTNNEMPVPTSVSTEDVLMEILENSRATKKYIKWQLYITVVMVVIPLIAMVVILPLVFKSVTSVYSGSGLLQ
jgi:hypothetical protein